MFVVPDGDEFIPVKTDVIENCGLTRLGMTDCATE
jgi:hypothetical protein